MMQEHVRRPPCLKEKLSGHYPIRRACQRVEGRPGVDMTFTDYDFRRDKRRCALEDSLGSRQIWFVSTRLIFHDPEVQYLQIVVLVPEAGHEKIRRFYVPMPQAVFVRFGK